MEGKIVNYRGGRRTHYENQMVVDINGCKNKEEASKLIGSKAEWTTTANKKMVGKITQAHGNNGCVLVRFNKGPPGQSIGTGIEIVEKA